MTNKAKYKCENGHCNIIITAMQGKDMRMVKTTVRRKIFLENYEKNDGKINCLCNELKRYILGCTRGEEIEDRGCI